jgi:hypothetical protein
MTDSTPTREVITPAPKRGSRILLVIGIVVAGALAAGVVLGPRTMCRVGSKAAIARATVDQLAYETYPTWLVDHPDRPCPPSFAALIDRVEARDPWDRPYYLVCRDVGIIVVSAGEDGKLGTDDDIRSDRAP